MLAKLGQNVDKLIDRVHKAPPPRPRGPAKTPKAGASL